MEKRAIIDCRLFHIVSIHYDFYSWWQGFGKIIDENDEEKRAKNGTLRDSTVDYLWIGENAIDVYLYGSIREKRDEKSVKRSRDSYCFEFGCYQWDR